LTSLLVKTRGERRTPGDRQYVLGRVIGLLKRLGETPSSKPESRTLFEELTGYSWEYSGKEWVKSLEAIKARYERESKRVLKLRGYA